MHFASAWLEDIKHKQKMHLWDVLSWSLELPSAHPPPACFLHCETGKIQFKDMPCTKGIYVAIELAVYGSFILKSRNEKKKFKYCSICRMKPTTLKAKKSKKKKRCFVLHSLAVFKTMTLETCTFLLIQYRCPHCWRCSCMRYEILWTTQTHSWLYRGRVTELHRAHREQSMIAGANSSVKPNSSLRKEQHLQLLLYF